MKHNEMKRLTALILFLLMGIPFLMAQKTVKVSGKITDDSNETMIGVSIMEKGTNNGIITDFNGNYSLFVHVWNSPYY